MELVVMELVVMGVVEEPLQVAVQEVRSRVEESQVRDDWEL